VNNGNYCRCSQLKKTWFFDNCVNWRGFITVERISIVLVALVLRHFYFSGPCQFTHLHSLRSVIFDLTPLWLAAHLDADRAVWISLRGVKPGDRALTATYVRYRELDVYADNVVCLNLAKPFLFYLQTPRWHNQPGDKEKHTHRKE
jgi:hypothetical protein